MDVLVFELGDQQYGLPAWQTVEVLRAATITPLPKAPTIVEGVIDVRGIIIPILDIRSRFRITAKPLAVSDQFIVARVGTRQVAIRVDRAIRLAEIADTDLRALTHLAQHHDYIAGAATLADGLVIIHDLETFLSESEAQSIDQALDASPNQTYATS